MNNFDYLLKVKNGAGWRGFGRVRLLISVGKEYHEGKKLQAVANWINRNPSITSVHVSVNDLLQRHNLIAEGLSEKEAALRSKAEGALWMTRNESILSDIHTPVVLSRWEDWFGREDFAPTLEALLAYKAQNPQFEAALKEDATSLAARKALRGETVPARLIEHSQNYVEEELAVFALQSRELPAAEVYPGSNLKSAEYFLKQAMSDDVEIPEAVLPLVSRHFTRVDFDRKPHCLPRQVAGHSQQLRA